MSNVISFNPEFKIGEVVCAKVDPDEEFMIIGYNITAVDVEGYVLSFDYRTRGKTGYVEFKAFEITESLLNNKINKS